MALGGGGTLLGFSGGIFTPISLARAASNRSAIAKAGKPLFIQISDSHIGFNKDANPDVPGTLKETIGLVNGMDEMPTLAIHTGDITHLSKAEQFDAAQQLFATIKVSEFHTVPGEHDVTDGLGTEYFNRFGKA